MKKSNSLFLGLVTLALISMGTLTTSCSRSGYPENPKNGERYYDSRGNLNVWNAALGYWMITSMNNGRYTHHYYYPSSGIYRDENRREVTRPGYVPIYRSSPATRSSFFGRSSSIGKSSGVGRTGGFGSSGRSAVS